MATTIFDTKRSSTQDHSHIEFSNRADKLRQRNTFLRQAEQKLRQAMTEKDTERAALLAGDALVFCRRFIRFNSSNH